jgi:hypothetical protein
VEKKRRRTEEERAGNLLEEYWGAICNGKKIKN